MSYDSRKLLPGQEFVEEIEILFNGCKHCVDLYGDNNIFVKSGTDTYTAASVNFTLTTNSTIYTGWYSKWLPYPSGSLYAEVNKNGEIIKCNIVNSTSIQVTGRGQFGTTASSIDANEIFRFIHVGEADNSCYGFSQTCSDSTSFDSAVFRRVKFSTSQMSAGFTYLPGLHHKSISYDSAEVDIGESIGSPAKLTFKIQDFNGGENIVVPYRNRQSVAGTFWGRMLARNPYQSGRGVIYRSGLRPSGTYSAPDFIERNFIIDALGLSDGMASCSCLDPIILTEDKKAKMPVTSPAQLSAAISGSPAAFSYVNAPDFYFGALNSVIYVRIDSEIIRATVSAAKQLTVSQRGYKSSAKDHDAGATIQDCVRLAGTHVIDAIVFALSNYTKVPSSYIGNYTAIKALIPSVDLDEAIISKPMAVSEFISSMIRLGNLIFYFDESTLKFVINYIPELSIQPININEEGQIKRGSVSVNQNSKEQWTRFAHLWAPVDVTKDSEENFAISYLAVNTSVESPAKMGEINEKKTFKNQLLTASAGDSLIGTSYCSRVVSGADKKPIIVNATINASSVGPTQGGDLKLGSIINLVTKENQGVDGLPSAELFQVVKLSGNAFSDFNVKMRRYLAVRPSGVDFVITSGGVNYNLASQFAPAAGTYTVYIEQGVVFGSYNVLTPAFTTGAQAAGVVLKIILRGSILGMGGAGGDAGVSGTPAKIGQSGGIAFNATVPCTIDSGSGLIWAGGGGATGNVYISPQGPNSSPIPRRGGGGGQGFGTALGGLNTNGVSFTDRAESGNQSSPGTENCPDGGEWGAAAERSDGQPGGLAGEAIKSNGNTVTIVAGNNDFNIRGRRT